MLSLCEDPDVQGKLSVLQTQHKGEDPAESLEPGAGCHPQGGPVVGGLYVWVAGGPGCACPAGSTGWPCLPLLRRLLPPPLLVTLQPHCPPSLSLTQLRVLRLSAPCSHAQLATGEPFSLFILPSVHSAAICGVLSGYWF